MQFQIVNVKALILYMYIKRYQFFSNLLNLLMFRLKREHNLVKMYAKSYQTSLVFSAIDA